MSNKTTDRPIPEFTFICGAVGSGNTFMFNCVTQDENVYGISEDALGGTLDRLLQSEKDTGKCPHSVDAFVDFMDSLRRDRRTLVLKTPSNIRYKKSIRRYLPNSRFILMIREPHAAIVSGLARHAAGCTVETAARIWHEDCQIHLTAGDDSITVTFEDLIADPVSTLTRVSELALPLSPRVFTYATRMHRPERMESSWWRAKVDQRVQEEIEQWVEKLDLAAVYRSVCETAGSSVDRLQGERKGIAAHRLLKPLLRAKKEFFRGWYKVVRSFGK